MTNDIICEQIFHAISSRDLNQLKLLLDNKNNHEIDEIFSNDITDKKSLRYALFVASMRDKNDVITNYLFEKYKNYAINECKMCNSKEHSEHFEHILKTDMDIFLKEFYHACKYENFELIKFLVKHGGDVEIFDKLGSGCLNEVLLSSNRDPVLLIKYLAELGADVNRPASNGYLPLHNCVPGGYIQSIKILRRYGARLDVNCYGQTPLFVAALYSQEETLNYLISIPNYFSREEKIEALELFIARRVFSPRKNKDYKELSLCDKIIVVQYWKRALSERFNNSNSIIEIPQTPFATMFNIAKEISDPNQLDYLLNRDTEQMIMQLLVIIERVLGSSNCHTISAIVHCSKIYCQRDDYETSLKYLNYALDSYVTASPDFTQVDDTLHFSNFYDILTKLALQRSVKSEAIAIFSKMVASLKRANLTVIKSEIFTKDYIHDRMTDCLKYIRFLTTLITDVNSKEYTDFMNNIFELITVNMRDRKGYTILHTAISEHLGLVPLLLNAGADPDDTDEHGNTALHILVLKTYRFSIGLADKLLDSGAHLDAVNNNGETFQFLLKNRTGLDLWFPTLFPELKCLAARAIRKSNLNIHHLPVRLQKFVLLH